MQYQAQSHLGIAQPVDKPGQGKDLPKSPVSKIDGLVTKGVNERVPGVLFFDAMITREQRPIEGLPVPVNETKWMVHPIRARSARMSGLSKSMLALLGNTKVRDLQLPIVYRVASYWSQSRPIEFSGGGMGSPPDEPVLLGTPDSLYHFTMAVDEAGSTQVSKLQTYQKEQLDAVGGPNGLHQWLGANTLVGLGVQADRD
jgi:hypothetical protein